MCRIRADTNKLLFRTGRQVRGGRFLFRRFNDLNILVDIIVMFSMAKYTAGGEVNQVYGCITALGILIVAGILEKTILAESAGNLPVFYRIALGSVPAVSIYGKMPL